MTIISTASGFAAASQALVETFPVRGDARQFLGCWIPEIKLQTSIQRCMEAHGDAQRWWDDLDLYQD